MSPTKLLAAGFTAALMSVGTPIAPPAAAGTCNSPVVIWFYAGASAPAAPNGRVVVPARTDLGADACSNGVPGDLFYVTPGASFAIAQLNTHVSTAPGACFSGLIQVCDSSKLVGGPNGTTYAQTQIYPFDPAAIGTITASIGGHSQTYKTISWD